jgi:hypothetical protein
MTPVLAASTWWLAADALRSRWRPKAAPRSDDEVHGAHVDPELQRRGRDERADATPFNRSST